MDCFHESLQAVERGKETKVSELFSMKKMDTAVTLPENRLFWEIGEKEQERILTCSKSSIYRYEEDEYIFRQGEMPSKLFLLLEGKVALTKNFASGKRHVLFLLEAGSIFGETFLFSGSGNYWYDAVAEEEAVVLAVPWRFFYDFCKNACEHHQRITRNMLELLSEKNFQMTRKLHFLSGTTLRERIALWLLETSKNGTDVEITMNREELADYLGTTRPSLSRELMKMQQEGLIDVKKKKILLVDKISLENL